VSADETPRAGTGNTEAPAPTSIRPGEDEAVPEKLDGRYLVEREIARGGMGRIFVGRDVRLGRPIAIKILRRPDPLAIARFEHESRLSARLQHPGIVTVYDAAFLPTGEPFLVMKLVLGRSLERAIADAETLDDRLSLLPHLTAVMDALAYAHDQGIVHRDLKPQNIVLGAFGETVVLDWGLAKSVDVPASPATDAKPPPRLAASGGLTLDGTILGTPAYMPPEQAAGDVVDARADVYALGAILYQTLAGQPPTSERDAAPPPLGRLEPHVPKDLLAIVDKAMARQRDGRYPSAFELGEDLRRFLGGKRVAANRKTWPVRLRRLFKRSQPLP
jgi:serine/threonine protein kinase